MGPASSKEPTERQKKELRISLLEKSIKDAEWRIGSHVVDVMEIDQYVINQKKLILNWTMELVDLTQQISEVK